MEKQSTYPEKITTLYSVWVWADAGDGTPAYKEMHGYAHIDPASAVAVALKHRGEVREVSV